MPTSPFRLSALLLATLLAACAAPVSTAIKPTEAHLAKYQELSSLDVVTALEKNVNEAKAADMPFLAPHYFREASQVLSDSQNGLSHQSKEQLVQHAAKGDAILEKGRAIMAVVQYRFSKELELKGQLDKLDTPKLLPKEYTSVIADFSSLIEKIEREQPDNIETRKETLYKNMQALEVRAVQEGALRQSELINAESKTKNAEKQIPATYAEAVRIFTDAKTQIATAHHDTERVQRLGAQALFAARHAQQVNERVTDLQTQLKGTSSNLPSIGLVAGGMASIAQVSTQIGSGSSGIEKAAMEKIVLQEEDRLLSLSTALAYQDLRDRPLDKQIQELKRVATNLTAQAKNEAGLSATKDLEARLQEAQDATQKALMQLEDKNKQLADQAAQLADKDGQIGKLNEQVAKLGATIVAKEQAHPARAKKN